MLVEAWMSEEWLEGINYDLNLFHQCQDVAEWIVKEGDWRRFFIRVSLENYDRIWKESIRNKIRLGVLRIVERNNILKEEFSNALDKVLLEEPITMIGAWCLQIEIFSIDQLKKMLKVYREKVKQKDLILTCTLIEKILANEDDEELKEWWYLIVNDEHYNYSSKLRFRNLKQ